MKTDRPSRVDDLLDALRRARQAFMNGETCSLVWMRERRMIMKEAEILGITDELLARGSEM